MLDKYKSGQPILYNVLMNAILNNKLSHAYLFDSNGNPETMDIILSFVKMIVCLNKSDEDTINICKRVDNGNYLDIKIIESNGIWIKKEQLLSLQEEFSKKAIEGEKKVYIIKSADKMNIQTANSLLKFLEEPVDDIIAILVVDNINLMLPTIISRCQVVKVNKNKYNANTLLNFNDLLVGIGYSKIVIDDKEEFILNVINFIVSLESCGIDTLIYTKKMWHNIFKDRDLSIIALELMINFYNDLIKYMSSIDNLFFKDYVEYIVDIVKNNDYVSVSDKIEILDNAINSMKKNLNINLIIDRLIIDMCGGNK